MTSRPLRTGLKQVLVRLGLTRLVTPILGGEGSILVFHRVRPPHPGARLEINSRNIVTPEHFGDLLDSGAALGLDFVALDDIPARLERRAKRRFACLTFDDGYRDNYEFAMPIAARFGAPITVYVSPGLVDGTAPLWWYGLEEALRRDRRLRLPIPGLEDLAADTPDATRKAFAIATAWMLSVGTVGRDAVAAALAERHGVDFNALAREHMMSWEMIRTMATLPGVEIGAHTTTHPVLARLDPGEARREIDQSRSRLEAETGRPVRHFAYPFGGTDAVGRREFALAEAAGFASSATAVPGNLGRGHLRARQAWPRHGIGPADDPAALALKLAGISRTALRTPRWD